MTFPLFLCLSFAQFVPFLSPEFYEPVQLRVARYNIFMRLLGLAAPLVKGVTFHIEVQFYNPMREMRDEV
jgi:hypothetical protein